MRQQYEEQVELIENILTEEFEQRIRKVQETKENLEQELQEQKGKTKLRKEQLKAVLKQSVAATETAEFHHGICKKNPCQNGVMHLNQF
ncbi:hypothetical protein B9Z55_027558 [Caenorhabditis nigoni]|uniref:Uncharacterized protein n=1 Tax=Caenorhabditis nigoni TaxID=1611254 RepID=A0A2G5SFF7_9PELO|nr:hypothetical protein B9Z55_027558 [Caenorhabditis nigoni]